MGWVHSIETMGAVDGPGLRMVVFLQGCPLRCQYCHNPDTWNIDGGEEMTAEELFKKALRYRPYFKETGGITLSGGEPFFQADFARDILKLCSESGIHTAVDTSGFCLNDAVKEALSYTDLVILDVKHTDASAYRTLTGQPISHNRAFLDYLISIQKPLWIRQVIVPGITDSTDSIDGLLKYIKGANVERAELLPYHTLGISKYEKLGLSYPLKDVSPPDDEKVKALQAYLKEHL